MKHSKEALVASWKRRSCQDLKAAKILTGEGGMRETRLYPLACSFYQTYFGAEKGCLSMGNGAYFDDVKKNQYVSLVRPRTILDCETENQGMIPRKADPIDFLDPVNLLHMTMLVTIIQVGNKGV